MKPAHSNADLCRADELLQRYREHLPETTPNGHMLGASWGILSDGAYIAFSSGKDPRPATLTEIERELGLLPEEMARAMRDLTHAAVSYRERQRDASRLTG